MKNTAKLTLLTASITAILSAPAMATNADDIGGINFKLDQTNQRIEGVNNNANLGINTVSSHLKVTNAQVASNQHLLNSVENGVKSNTNNIYHLEQQIHVNESAIYSQMDDNKAASNQLTMHALQMSAQNRQDNADQQKTIDENHARLSNQEMTINDQSGRIHTAEQDSQHALGAIATMDKSITAINDHTAKAEASIQAFASRTTDSIKANTQIGLDAQVAAVNAQSTASKNTSDIANNAKDIEGNTQIGLDAQVAAANAQSSASKNSSDIALANEHTAKAEASIQAFAGRATDSINSNSTAIADNTQIGLDAQVAAVNAQSTASKNTSDIANNAKDIEGNTQIGLDAQVAAANAQSSASKNSSDIALANEHTAKAEASIQAFAGRATDSINSNSTAIADNTQIGLDAQVAAASAQSTASKNISDIANNAKDIEGNTQIGLDAQVAAANAQSSASKNSSDIAINAEGIAQNESKTEVNAESNQLTRNEAAQVITANAHAIQSNYDDVYAVRGQTRSNTTQIANNAQDIHQNRVDINKNTADIKDLRSDLEEQAKQTAGIGAMAMATSNLVMPYSVGKFSVTAGVGNYDSESAIAVGSGYRFDDHLTVRANAAYETGSENVGIGAGVGYEF
ncbi:YadA C-terminal domain-containing protein [Vibrio splendidus]|uniref:YadA C-terminal domain-containing protein n=1 Tax=Vibrio splendidus TaxID=29497 RepID=UPI0027326F8F|nr:YadA C-terminal domain-containing protein [Vibrio splendidus]MDP2592886.1 YadA C-terminal domain-containing protein [Vibrio splendidus]